MSSWVIDLGSIWVEVTIASVFPMKQSNGWLYATRLSAGRPVVPEGPITMWFVRTPIMRLCTSQTKTSNRDILVLIAKPAAVCYSDR